MRSHLLALLVVVAACSTGCGKKNPTVDVEKLPCAERRPTSGFDVPEGYIACTAPTSEITVGDFTCRKGTSVGVYAKSKTLEECWVTKPTKVGDVLCTGGVSLFPEGQLRRCQLEAEHTKNGITMAKGTWITFYPDGSPRRLELGAGGPLPPYTCKGGWNYAYESGKPKKCELAAAATIDGQAKKPGETVCFEESGKLTPCDKVKL